MYTLLYTTVSMYIYIIVIHTVLSYVNPYPANVENMASY